MRHSGFARECREITSAHRRRSLTPADYSPGSGRYFVWTSWSSEEASSGSRPRTTRQMQERTSRSSSRTRWGRGARRGPRAESARSSPRGSTWSSRWGAGRSGYVRGGLRRRHGVSETRVPLLAREEVTAAQFERNVEMQNEFGVETGSVAWDADFVVNAAGAWASGSAKSPSWTTPAASSPDRRRGPERTGGRGRAAHRRPRHGGDGPRSVCRECPSRGIAIVPVLTASILQAYTRNGWRGARRGRPRDGVRL